MIAALSAVKTAWRVVSRVPSWMWGALAIGVALGATVGAVKTYGANQFERGRQAMIADGLRYDREALRIEREHWRRQVDSLRREVDALAGRVSGTVADAQSVARRIPPNVRKVPEVDSLVQLVDALAPQVAALTTQVQRERAAADALTATYDKSLKQITATAQQQAVRIAELEKRPTRKAAALRMLGGAVVGVLVGLAL